MCLIKYFNLYYYKGPTYRLGQPGTFISKPLPLLSISEHRIRVGRLTASLWQMGNTYFMWCHKSRPERVKSVGGDRVKGAFAFVKMLISSTAQNTQNVRNYVGFN